MCEYVISFKKKDEWNASSTVLLFSTSPSSYVKVFMVNAVATAASYPKYPCSFYI